MNFKDMIRKISVIILSLVILTACQTTKKPHSIPTASPTTTVIVPHALPSLSPTQPLPASSPTPWPLKVITVDKTTPTCTQLLQLKPGESTLQDVYRLAGYPNYTKNFPTGIVLAYYSQHIKFKHIILVNGVTGTVLLVGIVTYDESECPTFETLKARYGEPVLAVMNGNRHHWLFEGQDIADTEMVLQLLPPGTTLADYQTHNGYFGESYAFTP